MSRPFDAEPIRSLTPRPWIDVVEEAVVEANDKPVLVKEEDLGDRAISTFFLPRGFVKFVQPQKGLQSFLAFEDRGDLPARHIYGAVLGNDELTLSGSRIRHDLSEVLTSLSSPMIPQAA